MALLCPFPSPLSPHSPTHHCPASSTGSGVVSVRSPLREHAAGPGLGFVMTSEPAMVLGGASFYDTSTYRTVSSSSLPMRFHLSLRYHIHSGAGSRTVHDGRQTPGIIHTACPQRRNLVEAARFRVVCVSLVSCLPLPSMASPADESSAQVNAQTAYFPHISGGIGGSGGAANQQGGQGGDGLGPGFIISAQTVSQSIFYNIADPNRASTPAPTPAASDRNVNPVDNTCPRPSMHFQGRKSILSRLRTCFGPASTSHGHQIIVLLHGVAGIGKSQIAFRFIEESSARFKMSFKIDATSSETIRADFKKIAKDHNLRDSVSAALDWLEAQRDEWILLFDNADDIKLNLQQYIPRCSQGNILITSHNSVHRMCTQSILVSELELDEALLLFTGITSVKLQENHNQTCVTELMEAVYRKQLPILGPDHEDVAAVKSAMEDSEEAIMLGSLGQLGIAAMQTWWSSKYKERI
ncbi:hypothetical protein HMN09_01117300 [Mycena chlorophos]|uniref:NB-ARC domain-containing protein n=1 Tax=Mycena chlorophos TaxID=658473 RepID=A0A8H6SD91_MYCCL|nr:hypothetical protein HMN09_01117300 [Mycena chlorophos]